MAVLKKLQESQSSPKSPSAETLQQIHAKIFSVIYKETRRRAVVHCKDQQSALSIYEDWKTPMGSNRTLTCR